MTDDCDLECRHGALRTECIFCFENVAWNSCLNEAQRIIQAAFRPWTGHEPIQVNGRAVIQTLAEIMNEFSRVRR